MTKPEGTAAKGRDIEKYEDLLLTLYLHVNWQSITRQMTTEEKELFADSVDASSLRLNGGDKGGSIVTPRFWRGDYRERP